MVHIDHRGFTSLCLSEQLLHHGLKFFPEQGEEVGCQEHSIWRFEEGHHFFAHKLFIFQQSGLGRLFDSLSAHLSQNDRISEIMDIWNLALFDP